MPRLKVKPDNSDEEEYCYNNQDIRNGIADDKKTKRKKMLRRQAMLNRCVNHCEGIWSLEQNRLYVKFLQENISDFQSQYFRRSKKVFYRLSEILPERTSEQCRSHHQKLQKQTNSENPQDIIDYVKERIATKEIKNSKGKKTQLDKNLELEENGWKIKDYFHYSNHNIKITLNLDLVAEWSSE